MLNRTDDTFLARPALENARVPGAAVTAQSSGGARHAADAVTVYADLSALPPSYAALFARAQSDSFFHSHAWYRNFVANALNPGESVRVYGVAGNAADDDPTAALLMRHAAQPQKGGRARLLQSLSNYYSSLHAPLCLSPDAVGPLGAIAGRLAAERPRWDVIEIQPLDPACITTAALEQALRNSGFLVDRFFCFGNWYLEVGGLAFKDYFARRPKKLSKNAPRSRRNLEASGRMRLTIVKSRDGLEEAKAAYHTIYNASWKQGEAFPGFIDGLLDFTADLGWLRLGVIYIDGIPAAAQIWFVTNATASIFKMAYDSKFTKESVGTVLSSYLMEHVIDTDQVRIVDYLSGDDSYKRDWMSHRRERWGIVAFNPRTVRGLAAAAKHFGGRALRRYFPALASSGPNAQSNVTQSK